MVPIPNIPIFSLHDIQIFVANQMQIQNVLNLLSCFFFSNSHIAKSN